MFCTQTAFRSLRLQRPPRLTVILRTVALWTLLAATGWATVTADQDRRTKRPDPNLIRSMEAIREAFRTRQTDRLAALLPGGGRVFLGVRAIAPEQGFYSRDQVEALLRQAFAAFETIQFDINMNLQPFGDREGTTVYLCPAAWGYMDKGVRHDLNLRFLLARQRDRWMLSEIREAR